MLGQMLRGPQQDQQTLAAQKSASLGPWVGEEGAQGFPPSVPNNQKVETGVEMVVVVLWW